jgi:hypothetical protein
MSIDVFEGNSGFLNILIGLLIHNIPAITLLIILIISWKHEIVGGIGFIIGAIFYNLMILTTAFKTGFEWYYLAWSVQISGPALLIGILFTMGWFKKRNKITKNNV